MQKRKEALGALRASSGPVLSMLGDVVHDLSEEVDGLRTFEQDAAFAAELAWRIDKRVQLSDPVLEALDGVIIFFVALAAVGIWRAAARRDKLRNARIDRIQAKLKERGPQLADAMQKRLERRLKRLKRLASNRNS
jgi:hypothetical protein